MGEMFVVEFRQAFAIVDGLAHDEHRGKREVVIVDNLGKVFQHAAVDALVGPCEVVTGSDGRILGIFHQQFPLHVVNDGSAEENAHGALAASQQVQLLLLGHGRAALATREDNSLGALGDGELAPQFGSSSKE